MKSTFFLVLVLFTSFSYASRDRELRLLSQLDVSRVEVLELNRDYSELLTGVLYMYQWFDGSHDYTLLLRLDEQYEFECASSLDLKTKRFRIEYCVGKNHDLDFDGFVKKSDEAVYF